ncbi:MAG: endonuclease/exonuclease/phosphatase family protein [Parvibaculum sp.]|uniref:endonuclease/exonuclease/phosphatase family protein n=1 Tax=Parvibaculum sp. TaxID=2024848 RepID=UPI00283BC05C|nr:endonuclease/exonuclease/phosphatase family protein [Parvibaculum sp.]MDR3499399.1 endonuclease/exonuclease/phosphatase family protein [Parvibaculum sp.]
MTPIRGRRMFRWPRKPDWRGVAQFGAAWIGVAYTAFVLIWIAFRTTTGEEIGIVRYATVFQPWIALGCFAVAGFYFWRRAWWAGPLPLLLALVLGGPYFHLFWPSRADARGPVAFTAMTFNTYGLNKTPEGVVRIVLAQKPDIAFLQEVSAPDDVVAGLRGLYGGAQVYFAREPSLELLVASRFPLTALPPVEGIQKVVVHLPQGDLTTWNLHGPKTYYGTDLQYRVIRKLAADVDATSGAALAAGDFNATEQSAVYSYLIDRLHDAHADAGFGLGATFPARGRRLGIFPAMIRIDHLFFTPPLAVLETHVVGDSGGSDHYPVYARFAWGPSQ